MEQRDLRDNTYDNLTVLVAISGGIDSAATTLMLRERGFWVTGLYIDMLGSSDLRQKAIDVADLLGIELHIEDVVAEFREKIIQHALDEHQAGRTPSPCVRCNPQIKWAVAERVADRLGIHHIATGHYVRIVDSHIHKGVDPTKDQSYYLWALPAGTIQRAITPLGDYTKQQVREYLRNHRGFEHLAGSGESMSICFVGKTPYDQFLRHHLSVKQGAVIDSKGGESIGSHDGYQLYTIGQRRGFTGGGTVVRVDSTQNRVFTSTDPSEQYQNKITIENWTLRETLPVEVLHIKVRGIGRNPQGAIQSLNPLQNGTLEVTLSQADAWAVADGQPVVIYSGDRVVGGGWVKNL